jgi:hypothetical protein
LVFPLPQTEGAKGREAERGGERPRARHQAPTHTASAPQRVFLLPKTPSVHEGHRTATRWGLANGMVFHVDRLGVRYPTFMLASASRASQHVAHSERDQAALGAEVQSTLRSGASCPISPRRTFLTTPPTWVPNTRYLRSTYRPSPVVNAWTTEATHTSGWQPRLRCVHILRSNGATPRRGRRDEPPRRSVVVALRLSRPSPRPQLRR